MEGNKIMQAMSQRKCLEKDRIRHAEIPLFPFSRMDEIPIASSGRITTLFVSICAFKSYHLLRSVDPSKCTQA